VQQIADAAEVSESTFFRYFPTKADVVLWDEFDPLIIDAFRRQPAGVSALEALRGAFREALGQLSPEQYADQRDRTALVLTVPELRAGMLDQLIQATGLLAALVAERAGRSADDLDVRTFAGAVIGAAMTASLALVEHPASDFVEVLDATLAHLQSGLAL
jgi:AcrR family transcriptional regulator